MNGNKKPSPPLRWLNRTVLGIGLASLFSDFSHEIATALLPTFLATMGAAAVWLGIIEGVSDGLSSVAKMGSGFYTDKLQRRKPIAVLGYVVTVFISVKHVEEADGERRINALLVQGRPPRSALRACDRTGV